MNFFFFICIIIFLWQSSKGRTRRGRRLRAVDTQLKDIVAPQLKDIVETQVKDTIDTLLKDTVDT